MNVNSMLGLEPQSVNALAQSMKTSSEDLTMSAAHLRSALATVSWNGADSTRILAATQVCPNALVFAAAQLSRLAATLQAQCDEQCRASAAKDGAAVEGGVGATVGDGSLASLLGGKTLQQWESSPLWNPLGPLIALPRPPITSLFSDLLSKVAITQLALNYLNGRDAPFWRYVQALTRSTFERAMGLPVSDAQIFANVVGLVLTSPAFIGMALGHGVSTDLLREGDAEVSSGQPVPLNGEHNGQRPLTRPKDTLSLVNGLIDSQESRTIEGSDQNIRITQIVSSNGEHRYIVDIPGTVDMMSITGSKQAADMGSNISLMGNGNSAYQKSIAIAMEKAGIPPGAPVLLVSHSQGAIVASRLVQDQQFMSRFNVTNVLSIAGPVDGIPIPATVAMTRIEHRSDPIPHLDLNGSGSNYVPSPNVTKTVIEDPALSQDQKSSSNSKVAVAKSLGTAIAPSLGPLAGNVAATLNDVDNYHGLESYRGSIQNNADVRAKLDAQLAAFKASEDEQVSAQDFKVSRKR